MSAIAPNQTLFASRSVQPDRTVHADERPMTGARINGGLVTGLNKVLRHSGATATVGWDGKRVARLDTGVCGNYDANTFARTGTNAGLSSLFFANDVATIATRSYGGAAT